MASNSTKNLSLLRNAAFTYPIIDNHAHNLLLDTQRSAVPLDGLTSEASGEALKDATKSVASFRAINQLAQLYGCEPTLEAVKQTRSALPYEDMCQRNMKPTGIAMLLLDDGMDKIEEMCFDYRWHDRLTNIPTKRIVRIETVAQNLIKSLASQEKMKFEDFDEEFAEEIIAYCKDPQVVAFKSVACYRTGLDIFEPNYRDVRTNFFDTHESLRVTSRVRLAHKALNDYIVRIVLDIAGEYNKPVQFHTGLGDNDIRLSKSSPALMQSVIEEFSETKFILLHSSYPYTRDAGYLASTYKNVYLDFGEVFPMVSRDGQNTIIRQILELTPISKILWSTDGHWWPESFYLAVIQAREALYNVLSDYVSRGDMSEAQAVEAVENLFFHNSNRVYKLGLTPPQRTSLPALPASLIPSSSATLTLDTLTSAGIKFVRIHWVDYANTIRFRLLPVKFLQKMARPGFAIAKVALAFVVDAVPSRGYSPIGEWFLSLDLSSLRYTTYAPTHAFAMGFLEEKKLDGAGRVVEAPVCPRGILRRVVSEAKEEGAEFLVGFEIEFVLVDAKDHSFVNEGRWCAADCMPSGSDVVKVLDEVMEALEVAGVEVYQYHAEAALSQYEIVTGPLPPLEAVDALILTRQIISNIAQKYGMKMTLFPKPVAYQCGTGAHMHMSVSSPTGLGKTLFKGTPLNDLESWFLQGVLDHLPALCAFMLPSPSSYDRLIDYTWAGGTWSCWGRDNKDAAIRLCGSPEEGWNFEVKPMDGTGNPYLSTAAILYSGLLGIRQKTKLTIGDAQSVPAAMTEQERFGLGIKKKLAKNLDEAIELLKSDRELVEGLGEDLVDKYLLGVELRRDILCKMTEEEQRKWMITFY